MKKVLILSLLLFSTGVLASENVLKFGVAANNPNTPESLHVFLNFLSEKTGARFELVQVSVEDLLAKLTSGEIAFADLTSSVYATAVNLYGEKIRYVVTVAARNEKGELVPYYKGVFFARKDSPYKSVLDLKGKSFGFVSKTSTSGYIYPLATLSGMDINPDTFFGSVTFAGDHAKIFEGLKNGFLDGGVSNYDAYDKAKVVYGDIFRVIAETPEVPSGAIVASSAVDSNVVKKVEAALLSVKPVDPVVNYPGFLYKGWVKKGGGFYELVKKLVQHSLEIPSHPYP